MSDEIVRDKQEEKSLFAALKHIQELKTLSPTNLGPLLGIPWHDWSEERTGFGVTYSAHGRHWRNVELRSHIGGDKSEALLILEPEAHPSLNDVRREFGTGYSIIPPNPAARANATTGYEYHTPHGLLRFAAPYSSNSVISTIVIDRTQR